LNHRTDLHVIIGIQSVQVFAKPSPRAFDGNILDFKTPLAELGHGPSGKIDADRLDHLASAKRGLGAAANELLPTRMAALGLDLSTVARAKPTVFFDLNRRMRVGPEAGSSHAGLAGLLPERAGADAIGL
jgi:hypothetical protein